MNWKTTPQARATAARHVVLARQVVRKLRIEGIRAELLDLRDVHGIRHMPQNVLLMGVVPLLVRPIGWRVPYYGLDRLAIDDGAWVQRGTDVGELVGRCRTLLAQPWPSCAQTGRPLLLKK